MKAWKVQAVMYSFLVRAKERKGKLAEGMETGYQVDMAKHNTLISQELIVHC